MHSNQLAATLNACTCHTLVVCHCMRLHQSGIAMYADPCRHLQAADGVKRAQRGGMLTGAMLTAVASLLTGATRLQRGIISADASSQEGGQITEDSPIWPIYAPIKVSKPSITGV